MATIKEYLDYAELAHAAYVHGLIDGMYGASYGNVLTEKEFSITQATNFANQYKVLSSFPSSSLGMHIE